MVVQVSRSDDSGKDRPRANDPVTANDLPTVPRQLLDRHGARVLRPADVLTAPGWPAPRSTVYRAGTLLMSNMIFRDTINRPVIDEALLELNLGLTWPDSDKDKDGSRAKPVPDHVPRPVVLTPVDPSVPVLVDAWVALQHLRSATRRTKDAIDPKIVQRITLEHLMFSTGIGGTPWDSNGLDGTPWDSNALPGGNSYVRSAGGGPIPVTLPAFDPPTRNADGTLPRRPLVAVLDTGIGPHPWFGLADRSSPPPATGFLRVNQELQDVIATHSVAESATPVLDGYWDGPITREPLIGSLARDTGHGTFIAGIIRQVAPDADVLAIRVLHSDGVGYEGDVLLALWSLANQVRKTQETGEGDLIDVVSLSLGYYDGAPMSVDEDAYTGHIAAVLGDLTKRGVLVVAAAGNDATNRRFYPAALADEIVSDGPAVISVGARNPNGTKALFSNDANWVRYWAPGAAIVSTFPTDIQGSRTAGNVVPPLGRAGLDPDDFRSGFAVWDGTSFAAPLVAAKLAAALIDGAVGQETSGLEKVDLASTVERAHAAVKRLG